jgi:hypothetical protein
LLINNLYHSGTFGSLIRLYPLFDTNEKYLYVRVSDIDFPDNYFLNKETKIMETNNLDFLFLQYFPYIKPWTNPKYKISICACFILSKIKFPIKIFNNFLLKLTDYVVNCKKYDLIKEIQKKTQYKYKDENNHIPYGIDELFLNYYLLPVIINTKISFGIRVEFFPKKIIDILDTNINEKSINLKNQILSLEKKIYYNPNKNDIQKLKQLLNNFFKLNSHVDIKDYVDAVNQYNIQKDKLIDSMIYYVIYN